MTFLITGGAGFIGSHLIDELIKSKCNIIVIDDLSSGHLSNINELDKIQFIESKVQSIKIDDLSDIDGIFHLAAQASVPVSIDEFYSSSSNNLLSSIFIFNLAKKFKIPVVYASSSAIYGNLSLGDDLETNFDILSPYALDKLTMEKYASMMYNVYDIKSIGLKYVKIVF